MHGAAAGLHLAVTFATWVVDTGLAAASLVRGVKVHPLSGTGSGPARPAWHGAQGRPAGHTDPGGGRGGGLAARTGREAVRTAGYRKGMHVSQHQPSVGPEPGPGGVANRSLYVPVRRGPAGDVIRLWRTPFGTRTAVAFTSDRRLRSVLGPCEPWIRLSESALRGLAEPLGAARLTIDPVLTAKAPAAWSEPATSPECAVPAPQG